MVPTIGSGIKCHFFLDIILALSDTILMSTHSPTPKNSTRSDTHSPIGDGRLNKVLLWAAGLAATTTLMHIVGGGEAVAVPIAASSLADEPRLLGLAVWHMTSVALGLSVPALALGALPRHAARSQYLVRFISAIWIGFGLCVIAVALSESGDNLLKLPQPIMLIPIGVLGFWGAQSMQQSAKRLG